MAAQAYDVIVLGAGIMGSSAAYHISKTGQKVLLLEQFALDHKLGSSNDYTRIIRYFYDHPAYVNLAKANYPAWMEFEQETEQTFFIRTGGIDFGRPDQPYLQNAIAAATAVNLPFETLSPAAAQQRFPQFRFNEDMIVIYQESSGLLAAQRSVAAHVQMAQRYGATVKDHTPVTRIIPHANSVEVLTPEGHYTADRLIITAGSWAGRISSELDLKLPLTPTRCQVAYFRGDEPRNFETDRFPIFIAHVPDVYGPYVLYGLPSFENSGVKIAFHGGQAFSHPSEIDYTPDDAAVTDLRRFARDHIPGADSPLVSTRICLYTLTPDEHFIIDQHPQHPHIIIAAGFSGHGFKFGPIVGIILKDLALEGHTPHDISLFAISRFTEEGV